MPLTDVAPISPWSPQTARSILRGQNGLGAHLFNALQVHMASTLGKIKAAAEA